MGTQRGTIDFTKIIISESVITELSFFRLLSCIMRVNFLSEMRGNVEINVFVKASCYWFISKYTTEFPNDPYVTCG